MSDSWRARSGTHLRVGRRPRQSPTNAWRRERPRVPGCAVAGTTDECADGLVWWALRARSSRRAQRAPRVAEPLMDPARSRGELPQRPNDFDLVLVDDALFAALGPTAFEVLGEIRGAVKRHWGSATTSDSNFGLDEASGAANSVSLPEAACHLLREPPRCTPPNQ
eukprot:CAMPEP_0117572334 /NCGR_PEP_ID=MMETSP0784-20121206/60296_1 /TAXON_ID=39447 /ORGANISM="" /LENGTH=165 /DNA_ID=CAMNT_0005370687 /DNA_START=180 /DNA_END=674 /DNA_ORIENTATION=-